MSSVDLSRTEVISLETGSRTLEIEQVAGLSELAQQSVIHGTGAPYWAYLWPSAKALACLVGELPDLTGQRVLDLGCGVGAVSVAAAARGATVIAADVVPEAVELAKRNAARNGLSLEGLVMDWRSPPDDLGTFDGIAAADVFYEDGMLREVVRFVRKHLDPEGMAWITDPMRVMPGGVVGAGRLNGLDVIETVMVDGQIMTGGVTLYEIRRRKPKYW